MSAETPATKPSYELNEHGQKIWRNGTLTYTLGGLIVLFAILLGGDLVFAMRNRSIQPSMQILFKVFNSPTWYYGLIAVSIPTAMGMLIAPVVSFWSDRHRSRWGRRIPFLLVSTPIVSAAMIGIGCSTMAVNFIQQFFPDLSTNVLMLATLSITWLFFDVGAIVSGVIFMALIKDVVPECFFGRFMGLFRMVGLVAGIIYNYWIIGLVKVHYMYIFWSLGIIYGVAFFLICLLIREGKYPPPPSPPPVPERAGRFGVLLTNLEKGPFGPMLVYAKESFGSSYYVKVFLVLIPLGLMFVPINAFIIFYADDLTAQGVMDNTASFERALWAMLSFCGAGENQVLFNRIANVIGMYDDGIGFFGKCSALTFVVSFFLAYPLGALADRYHPLRCCLVVTVLAVITYGVVAHIIDSKLTFAIAVVAHNLISGVYWTVGMSLNLRLFPQARYAQFTSAAGLLDSVFMLAFFPLMAYFFDLIGKDYSYSFYMGMGIGIFSLVAAFFFMPHFKKHGGYNNYVAPEL